MVNKDILRQRNTKKPISMRNTKGSFPYEGENIRRKDGSSGMREKQEKW